MLTRINSDCFEPIDVRDDDYHKRLYTGRILQSAMPESLS